MNLFIRPDGKLVRYLHIPRTGGRFTDIICGESCKKALENSRIAYEVRSEEERAPHMQSKTARWLLDNNLSPFLLVTGDCDAGGISCVEMTHIPLAESNRFIEALRARDPDVPELGNTFTVIRHPVDRFKSTFPTFCDYLNGSYRVSKINSYDEFVFVMETVYVNKVVQTVRQDHKQAYLELGFLGMKNAPVQWWRSQLDYIDETVNIWRYEDGLGDEYFRWLEGLFGEGVRIEVPERANEVWKAPYDLLKFRLRMFDKFIPWIEEYCKEEIKALGY